MVNSKPHHNGMMQLSQELAAAKQRIAELEKQRDELVAENVTLKDFIETDCWVFNPNRGEYFDAAKYMPEPPQTDAEIAEIGARAVEQSDDKRRMDWLVSHVVQVRQPLFYGSHALFSGQCDSDDCEEYHSKLREQIDAEMSKENKLRGGGV